MDLRIRSAAVASLSLLSLRANAAPPSNPAPSPDIAPSSAPAPAPAPPEAALPDPTTYRQFPAPVPEAPPAVPPSRKVELGIDGGVADRPAGSGKVHYGVTGVFGFHARIDPLSWLGVRIFIRYEENGVSFDDGALGLPSGTTYDQDALARVYLGASVEPTWSPVSRVQLFAGVGAGWGRTTAQELHTGGAENAALPIRSAVFIEFPFSLGVRYELVRNWVAVSLVGSVGFLTNQDGSLLSAEQTPGISGKLVTVSGFPEFGTSLDVLAGVGLLL